MDRMFSATSTSRLDPAGPGVAGPDARAYSRMKPWRAAETSATKIFPAVRNARKAADGRVPSTLTGRLLPSTAVSSPTTPSLDIYKSDDVTLLWVATMNKVTDC